MSADKKDRPPCPTCGIGGWKLKASLAAWTAGTVLLPHLHGAEALDAMATACPSCGMTAEFRPGMRLARMIETDLDCAIQKLRELAQFADERGMKSTVAIADSMRLVQLGKAAIAVKQIADVFIDDVRQAKNKGRA